MIHERGGGGRALTSDGEDSPPAMAQGTFCYRTKARHSTLLRGVGQGQPSPGPGSQMGRARGSKGQAPMGTAGKEVGRRKARWMFSFPTQLTELYSEWMTRSCLVLTALEGPYSLGTQHGRTTFALPFPSKFLGPELGPTWNPFSEPILNLGLTLFPPTSPLVLPGPGRTHG